MDEKTPPTVMILPRHSSGDVTDLSGNCQFNVCVPSGSLQSLAKPFRRLCRSGLFRNYPNVVFDHLKETKLDCESLIAGWP